MGSALFGYFILYISWRIPIIVSIPVAMVKDVFIFIYTLNLNSHRK